MDVRANVRAFAARKAHRAPADQLPRDNLCASVASVEDLLVTNGESDRLNRLDCWKHCFPRAKSRKIDVVHVAGDLEPEIGGYPLKLDIEGRQDEIRESTTRGGSLWEVSVDRRESTSCTHYGNILAF